MKARLNDDGIYQPPSFLFIKPTPRLTTSTAHAQRKMSYGSSGHLAGSRSNPSRAPGTPPITDQDGDYFSPRRNSTFDGLNKRRRGKSPHDIMREGAISAEERSLQFGDIPIDKKDIKQLPRKVSHLKIELVADGLVERVL